jgi:hypothetical protein
VLNIKESNFPNVILIDLNMDPLEAAKIISQKIKALRAQIPEARLVK